MGPRTYVRTNTRGMRYTWTTQNARKSANYVYMYIVAYRGQGKV